MHKKLVFLTNSNTAIFLVLALLFANTSQSQIAKGADVGWLSYFENTLGITYLNDNGMTQDALQILKDHHMNAIRLRAFVNPTEAHIGEVSTQDVVKNAIRAKNLGLDVMITIHYSDTWADPGKQYKPASWQNLNFQQLSQAVYDYTYNFMDALLDAGVTPKWVQVGNETDPGFIWEDARLSSSNNFANMNNFVALSNRGYDAIKDRSPTTKVITHLSAGNSTNFLRDYFDDFYGKGGKNDIIGVSYYPRWHGGTVQNVASNLEMLSNRFDKDVMICEIGERETVSQDTTYNMIVDAIDLMEALPNNRGLGVFYWEPIAHSSINGYEQGLALPVANQQYQFSWVLDAFLNNAQNCTPTTIIPYVKINDDNWQQTSEIVGRVGNNITFNPQPVSGSNWSWRGPNGFTANTREIELSSIQKNQAGDYVVTYKPTNGCEASISYSLEIYDVGEIIIGNPGFENGEVAPWIGTGNYGIDTDLINSGIYSGWFGGGNSELSQTITGLSPNTTYDFTSYIRNWTGDNGVVTVGVRNHGNTTATTTVGLTGNNGNDFELAQLQFTTGSSNTTAVIYVSTTNSQTWGKLDDVKVVEANILSVLNLSQKQFTIFPNPASKEITVNIFNQVEPLQVIIYDTQGKQFISHQTKENESGIIKIHFSNLAKGIYFVQLNNELGSSFEKLLIE